MYRPPPLVVGAPKNVLPLHAAMQPKVALPRDVGRDALIAAPPLPARPARLPRLLVAVHRPLIMLPRAAARAARVRAAAAERAATAAAVRTAAAAAAATVAVAIVVEVIAHI